MNTNLKEEVSDTLKVICSYSHILATEMAMDKNNTKDLFEILKDCIDIAKKDSDYLIKSSQNQGEDNVVYLKDFRK